MADDVFYEILALIRQNPRPVESANVVKEINDKIRHTTNVSVLTALLPLAQYSHDGINTKSRLCFILLGKKLVVSALLILAHPDMDLRVDGENFLDTLADNYRKERLDNIVIRLQLLFLNSLTGFETIQLLVEEKYSAQAKRIAHDDPDYINRIFKIVGNEDAFNELFNELVEFSTETNDMIEKQRKNLVSIIERFTETFCATKIGNGKVIFDYFENRIINFSAILEQKRKETVRFVERSENYLESYPKLCDGYNYVRENIQRRAVELFEKIKTDVEKLNAILVEDSYVYEDILTSKLFLVKKESDNGNETIKVYLDLMLVPEFSANADSATKLYKINQYYRYLCNAKAELEVFLNQVNLMIDERQELKELRQAHSKKAEKRARRKEKARQRVLSTQSEVDGVDSQNPSSHSNGASPLSTSINGFSPELPALNESPEPTRSSSTTSMGSNNNILFAPVKTSPWLLVKDESPDEKVKYYCELIEKKWTKFSPIDKELCKMNLLAAMQEDKVECSSSQHRVMMFFILAYFNPLTALCVVEKISELLDADVLTDTYLRNIGDYFMVKQFDDYQKNKGEFTYEQKIFLAKIINEFYIKYGVEKLITLFKRWMTMVELDDRQHKLIGINLNLFASFAKDVDCNLALIDIVKLQKALCEQVINDIDMKNDLERYCEQWGTRRLQMVVSTYEQALSLKV